MPVMVWLGNRIGRHRALALGGGGFLALQLALLAVTPGAFDQALIVAVAGGLITSVIWVMPPALVGDTVEYGMLAGGGDQAALYMAAFNFVSKMAFAAGVGISLLLLDVLGFNPAGGNSADTLFGLKMVVIVLPVVPGLLGAAILFNHRLTAGEHAFIRRKLAERGVETGSA
jgi:Na+/melibiose symporter-like transporter